MELRDQLLMLGYDLLWIDWGLIDPLMLEHQIEAFGTAGDPNPEHYRYAAFLALLASHAGFDQTTLDRYIHLAGIDPDPAMAHAALCELITWQRLTSNQLDDLSLYPAFSKRPIPSLIQRRRLLTEFASMPLTQDLFLRMIDAGDKAIERCLLDRPDLSQEHLQILSERGSNRAHRNRARVRLNKS